MKEKYLTPYITVEDLDNTDVLLSSIITPMDSDDAERENAYHDITDFIMDFSHWFD